MYEHTHSGYRSILCHITIQSTGKNAVAFVFICYVYSHHGCKPMLSYAWYCPTNGWSGTCITGAFTPQVKKRKTFDKLSSGYLPGVWVLKADVLEHCVSSIFNRWWSVSEDWLVLTRIYTGRGSFGRWSGPITSGGRVGVGVVGVK